MRNSLVDGPNARYRLQQHAFRGVFVEKLAAASARHQDAAVAVDARERHQSFAAGHVQPRHECTLRTKCQAIRGVLDMAAGDDAAIIDEGRSTNWEFRIWHV